MVRTNVYVQRGAAFVVLCFLWGCDASLMNSGQRVVTPESTPQVESSALLQGPPPPAPETMPVVDPYDAETPSTEPQVAAAEVPVHYAELRGRIENQTGQRITIEPLVATSLTWPVPGCMANLWVESKKADGASDWQHIAEVKVVNRVEFGMPMEVDILDGTIQEPAEKQAQAKLSSGSRVRIQWQW